MAERSGIFGKLLALVQGEVAADTREAYRRAGQAVYDLLRLCCMNKRKSHLTFNHVVN